MRQRKKMQKRKKILITIMGIMTCLALSACTAKDTQENQGSVMEEQASTQERVETGFILTGPESYDSADTPVVVDIDRKKSTITFLNLNIGRRYTLSFDGTTKLYDKYGEGISLDQLKKGDIVDITFLKSKKHLTCLQYSATAWSYTDVERYELNLVRNEVTIGGEVYKLSNHALYLSQDRMIEKMELNAMDVLTFQGVDSTVLSVVVEKGHGYLRLLNDENFVGGWIEIGQQHIQRIADDMLLTVPEGSYDIQISHNGGGGTKSVVINRNEETALDIGDLTVAEAKTGMVLFSMTPSDAELYIDGSEVDSSKPITLEYGIHQIIAKAKGYKSLTQYIRVGQASAGLDIVLDAADKDTESGSSDSESSSTASSSDAITSYYKVYVDAPEKVEVYFDGNYMGISPCSFRKVSGSHEITLRRSGYETRSYTVLVDDEDKDISLSFADLLSNESYKSVSDNDAKNEDDD